jgi:type I restriction-modification system DNA methylase subunit
MPVQEVQEIPRAQIVQGNALEIDWSEVCPMTETTFIIGNPPFNGSLYQSKDQKEDTRRVWGRWNIRTSLQNED